MKNRTTPLDPDSSLAEDDVGFMPDYAGDPVSGSVLLPIMNATDDLAAAAELIQWRPRSKNGHAAALLTQTRGGEASSSMAAVAEAPLLTDAQIAVISFQMGLTPVDFDVARWVSPSRGRTCHDHGVTGTGPA